MKPEQDRTKGPCGSVQPSWGAWVGTLRRILQLKGTELLIDPALCLNASVGSAQGVVTGDSGTGACAMQIAECTPKRLSRLLYPVPYD